MNSHFMLIALTITLTVVEVGLKIFMQVTTDWALKQNCNFHGNFRSVQILKCMDVEDIIAL